MSLQTYLLAADMAELISRAGGAIRTSAAVRCAVIEGRLVPCGKTPRNVSVWTPEGAAENILRLKRAALYRHMAAAASRSLPEREPLQLEIPEDAA